MMKNVTSCIKALSMGIFFIASLSVKAQRWSLTPVNGTYPLDNIIGTKNNRPLIFKTNNMPRVTITSERYGGLIVGTTASPGYMSINGRDVVDTIIPFIVNGNILNQSWGNLRGKTMGRLIRLNQGPAFTLNGTVNFYDIGIGQDTCFFITNHSVPPAFGNGFIRKRMIVISPQDRVGINLAGDNIGNGAVPTANFHTNGTVRLQNLPSGTGNILVIDNDGNVFRSSSPVRMGEDSENEEMDKLKKEVDDLKKLVAQLVSAQENRREGYVRIATPEESRLFQNTPNPFSNVTTIKYVLPAIAQNAFLDIIDAGGKMVKRFNLAGKNNQPVEIANGELPAGTYFYSLIVDGRKIDTKKMVLSK